MKLTDKQIKEIKERNKNGESIRSIARDLNVSHSTVSYHLDKDSKRIARRKWWNNLSQERRKEIYNKRKGYLAGYMKKRYNEDEEFRDKKIKYQRDYRKNKK